MNRRDAALALVALGTVVPLAGLPQSTKTHRIGFIFGVTEQDAKLNFEGMLAGLRDYGYVPGTNVFIHVRYSANDAGRIATATDELIARNVDIVLTYDTVATVLRQKTSTLPIVLFNSADPVALGLVQSLGRPGTNVTGITAMHDQTIPKRIQLFLEIVPKMSRFAMLYDDSIDERLQEMHLRMARTIAQAKGLTIIPVKWSKPDELRATFEIIKKARPDALLLVPTFKGFSFRRELASEIRRLRVPSSTFFFVAPWFQESGALLGFGIDGVRQGRGAIRYVDQILKGANPAELPIEQFGIYNLAVNLIVARELGIKIPPSITARADDVIQ